MGQKVVQEKEPEESSNQLMVPSQATLVSAVDEEGFDLLDFAIARYKIVQPTSKVSGVEGSFLNLLTGEEVYELRVVFLAFWKGRILFPANNFKQGVKSCISGNGLTPDFSVLAKLGKKAKSQDCIKIEKGIKTPVCPYAQWKDLKGGKAKPPQCKETITLLGIEENNCMPFIISLHGASFSPTTRFLTSIKMKKKQAEILQSKSLKLRDFSLCMTLKLQSSDKGKYYYVEYSQVQELSNKKLREFLDSFFESFISQRKSQKRLED